VLHVSDDRSADGFDAAPTKESTLKLTNDSYTIFIRTKNSTERYYRDKSGWVKVSARGRTFRATAEQVLNHVLPALAGVKPNVTIKVDHHDEDAGPKT
jgi:hypothetical protein